MTTFGDLEDGEYFELVEKPGVMLLKNANGLVTNMDLDTCGIFRADVRVMAIANPSEWIGVNPASARKPT